ncbi:RhuM family protein [Amycolatopsis jiangsuensis]|uniref:Prophage antirepressor-like protein n=1 Tax=Amycolatopsis jiangsuensis TaxID=1181879 RepID=A0A840J7U2_9PSEU|nr:RhuM family protein [Amycolatopsis jiangsuensis]MBB4689843.1 prophage antirepressor-like protein [Amycolatopsis jiangsuensis]
MPFDFEGNNVRVVIDLNGEPWWIASDVCTILDLADVSSALSRVDPLDTTSTRVENSRGARVETKAVNESGLLDLVLDSRKPEARKFRRWITREVLPSIRRDGGYIREDASRTQLARLQEKIDYLEVRDLLTDAVDYDSTKRSTQTAFAMMQNRFHVAVTGQTATQLLATREQIRGAPRKDGNGLIKTKHAKDRLTDVELKAESALGRIIVGRLMLHTLSDAYTMADFTALVDEVIQENPVQPAD